MTEYKYFWVDPPSGYVWGFPKIAKLPVGEYDLAVFDLDKVLAQLGYPKDRIKTGDPTYTGICRVRIR